MTVLKKMTIMIRWNVKHTIKCSDIRYIFKMKIWLPEKFYYFSSIQMMIPAGCGVIWG